MTQEQLETQQVKHFFFRKYDDLDLISRGLTFGTERYITLRACDVLFRYLHASRGYITYSAFYPAGCSMYDHEYDSIDDIDPSDDKQDYEIILR